MPVVKNRRIPTGQNNPGTITEHDLFSHLGDKPRRNMVARRRAVGFRFLENRPCSNLFMKFRCKNSAIYQHLPREDPSEPWRGWLTPEISEYKIDATRVCWPKENETIALIRRDPFEIHPRHDDYTD